MRGDLRFEIHVVFSFVWKRDSAIIQSRRRRRPEMSVLLRSRAPLFPSASAGLITVPSLRILKAHNQRKQRASARILQPRLLIHPETTKERCRHSRSRKSGNQAREIGSVVDRGEPLPLDPPIYPRELATVRIWKIVVAQGLVVVVELNELLGASSPPFVHRDIVCRQSPHSTQRNTLKRPKGSLEKRRLVDDSRYFRPSSLLFCPPCPRSLLERDGVSRDGIAFTS